MFIDCLTCREPQTDDDDDDDDDGDVIYSTVCR